MREHALAAGCRDTLIVNTCAVTAEAVRQSKQTIRKLRRENPASRLVVTGCAAQLEPQRFAAMTEVDHVFGNGEKVRAETYRRLAGSRSHRVEVGDLAAMREPAPAMIDGFGSSVRAFVEIQNGCDHRCTFCIIPYGRGASRSVPAGEVVAQIRRLVAAGFAEVVLTGVDLTAYGCDLPGAIRLGTLVRQILRHVPELARLRLSSLDPAEVDPQLMAALAEEPRLMPHLHLSLQAGDDVILKRMKRRHSRAGAVAFCETARRLRPDLALGADLIVGFPTETEAMFANTLRLLDDCGLTFLHAFPYSRRPGTPAARMPQVSRDVARKRGARLRAKGEERLAAHLCALVGQEVELLVEDGRLGRTPSFAFLELDRAAEPGALVVARVERSDGKRLFGARLAARTNP
jgi:threonylcarbamoyladenosine tRNA methylthiotransferase MtaB